MFIVRFIKNDGFYFDYQRRGKIEFTKRGAERIAKRIHKNFGFAVYLIAA